MSSVNLNNLSQDELNKILKEEYEKNKKIKKKEMKNKKIKKKKTIQLIKKLQKQNAKLIQKSKSKSK